MKKTIGSKILAVAVAVTVMFSCSFVTTFANTDEVVVGEGGYATLQEAVNATTTGTIKLNKDVTENVTVAAGKTITLDLNGKTLSGGTVGGKAAITNNGTLVVKDSVGNGKVMREDNGTSGYYVVDNQGTMTIESGYFYNKTGPMPKGSSLIRNAGKDKAATLNIKGGTILHDGFIAVKNDDYGILNVTGGTIKTTGDTSEYTASAIQNWSQASITGGSVGNLWTGVWSKDLPNSETNIGGSAVVEGKIVVRQEGNDAADKLPTVSISGGTITADWRIADEKAEVTVSGGVFNTIDEKVKVTAPEVAEITINGETKTVLNVDAINEYIKNAPKGTKVVITKASKDVNFVAPVGTIVENETGSEITVNKQTVADGKVVEVEDPADNNNNNNNSNNGNNSTDKPTTDDKKTESPKTGDNTMVMGYAIIMLAALGIGGTLAVSKRKN